MTQPPDQVRARRRPLTAPAYRAPALALPARVVLAALFVAGVAIGLQSGFGAFWFVPYGAVGSLLVIRRPRLSIGWILLALAWCFALVPQTVVATPQQFEDGSIDTASLIVAIGTASLGSVGFFLIALLAMVFPSGALPSGRWSMVSRLTLGIAVVAIGLTIVEPRIPVNLWGNATSVRVRNPIALLPELPIWAVLTADTLILPVVVLLAAAAVSMLIRYRHADGVERQQLRWLAAAIVFVVIAVVGGFVLGTLIPALADTGLIWLGAIVAFPCVAIAVGIAVLRYRLYEIDRVISRSIGWAIVTLTLVATFGAIVIALQALLVGVTQGQTLAVAASTLVAFAIFQPVRRRVQAAVDRRFDRARYDAQRLAEGFAERVRDEVELGTLRGTLLRTAHQSVRPLSAAVWLRQSEPSR